MRQDRRKNGWIIIGAILQMVASVVLMSVGIALAVTGFLYNDKLAKIKELQFFINQEGIINAQKYIGGGRLLKPEFLYLFLGIIVGLVGVILLVLSIISLVYAKKKKVVRRRLALIFFTLIPFAVLECAMMYWILEGDMLPNNIIYGLYAVMGLFGLIVVCYLFGIIFGRSEKFMSNDNSKFAFDNNSLRSARVDVNNNEMEAQTQHINQPNIVSIPRQGNVYQPQPTQNRSAANVQPQNRPMPSRPVAQPRPMQRAPMGSVPVRQANQVSATARPVNSMNTARPMPSRPVGAPQRPIQQRPVQAGQMPRRPMNASVQSRLPQPKNGVRYCEKCGKQLLPQEMFCTLCGHRVNN